MNAIRKSLILLLVISIGLLGDGDDDPYDDNPSETSIVAEA